MSAFMLLTYGTSKDWSSHRRACVTYVRACVFVCRQLISFHSNTDVSRPPDVSGQQFGGSYFGQPFAVPARIGNDINDVAFM
eukprot:COSAG03_NODE_1150_length_4703_cov_101.178106_3_plen_82_part_00